LSSAFAGRFIAFSTIGQDLAFGHQRDDFVDVGIRIHVVQPDPHAKTAERAHEVGHARLQRPAAPETGAVPDVNAVCAGVLRDDEKLLHAGFHERFGFLHHVADGPAYEIAAHRRDNAERATVVAAFRDL
jgi:hypothetical protein